MELNGFKFVAGLAVIGSALGITISLSSQTTAQPTTAASAQSARLTPAQARLLSQVDAQGNWNSSLRGHQVWRVVDATPNGLNCRWFKANPRDWYAPHSTLPNRDIVNWPVRRQFQQGSVLVANITPGGFSFLYDARELAWIKVDIGPNNEICMVRANSRFVQPMPFELHPYNR